MKSKNIISFRLWGDYALFKKPWCNRDQQSYLVPTKTSISGMVGAILGYGKKEYLEKVPPDDMRVGIRLRKKIGKELLGYNFMQSANLKSKTKKFSNPYRNPPGKGMRSPTRLEMLKNPDYRVFIHFENEDIFRDFSNYLKEDKYVFPPFLGQNNLFGNIGNVKMEELELKDLNSVNSVVPSELVEVLELNGKIYNERIPVKMKTDRSSPEFLSLAIKNEKNSEISISGSSEKFLVGETSYGERIVLF